MGVVDELLTSPGVYVGVDRMAGSDHTGVARMVVTALPGGAGVRLDYEVVAGTGQVHVEHTMIGRTPGGAVMVIGHTQASSSPCSARPHRAPSSSATSRPPSR